MTLTGIDNNTSLERLAELTHKFPFVEWGVLLSSSKMGIGHRYPSKEFIVELQSFAFPLAGHLCGSWARDFVAGGTQFKQFLNENNLHHLFQRVQLNISNILSGVDQAVLRDVTNSFPKRCIIQIGRGGIPHGCANLGVDFLFDCSGGQGVVPQGWPRMVGVNDISFGYAGGLTPDNLEAQLELMAEAAGNAIWIDAESGVRTDDVLDLEKAENFLRTAQPYVIDGNINANNGESA